jgi:hypothetical protein
MIRLSRYVGTAPGTTTVSMGAAAPYPPYPPPDGGPGVPPYPTQAWLVPEPSKDDRVRIALPPNQHVTTPTEMIITKPNAQATMGPVPNDRSLGVRYGYQPVHKGWIHTKKGDIYTLQGGAQQVKIQGALGADGGMSSSEKWAIFASVMSGLALAATATVSILSYMDRKKR